MSQPDAEPQLPLQLPKQLLLPNQQAAFLSDEEGGQHDNSQLSWQCQERPGILFQEQARSHQGNAPGDSGGRQQQLWRGTVQSDLHREEAQEAEIPPDMFSAAVQLTTVNHDTGKQIIC